ncbi:hypothetical protein [Natrinema gari]|uniref:Uncharacterized protein n=1 Tax=Natrinema gari JCM 14663 TaxID=1230459 RepID=L9YZU5_9EURY|nr:hypothetical protein [Natrinema gari]ELY79634.1 hypothetical protein C486_11554 [Natrinema gari JCM 14663]
MTTIGWYVHGIYRVGYSLEDPILSTVSHVRLRNDELVVSRGLFDVRFERDELAALEAAHEEIERRLPNRSVG